MYVGGKTEGNQELVQDIQRYGLYRGEMQWRSVGLTKTKAFGAGVSHMHYNDVKTLCPTFIKNKRKSEGTGRYDTEMIDLFKVLKFSVLALSPPTKIQVKENCQPNCNFELEIISGDSKCTTDMNHNNAQTERGDRMYTQENFGHNCTSTTFDIMNNKVKLVKKAGTIDGDWIRIFFENDRYVECKISQDSSQVFACSYPVASWKGITYIAKYVVT